MVSAIPLDKYADPAEKGAEEKTMVRSFIFEQGKLVGEDIDLDALRLIRADPGLYVWVDLDRPTEAEVKQVLEGVFSFHPLAIEDCVSLSPLPKIEDYEDYLFMVVHGVDFSKEEQFSTTELDIFLGKEFLVTYHTAALRSPLAVIDRIKQNPNNCPRGPDRLAHSIIDFLVDHYRPALEELRQEIQELENDLFDAPSRDLAKDILFARKELSQFRAIMRPQQEIISRLARGEFKMIRSHLLPYFRDVADNIARYDSDAVIYGDQLFLAFDVYLNRAQMGTNEVIKVLTILTAVTTPITVLGSWYGMNFHGMPELSAPGGYWVALIFTVVSTIVLMVYMRWKKWI